MTLAIRFNEQYLQILIIYESENFLLIYKTGSFNRNKHTLVSGGINKLPCNRVIIVKMRW